MQNAILEMVGEFCTKHLNDEYWELSERLILKLGRKRNPPFETGQPEIWAAGIIHALGSINFLFDKSFLPFVTIDQINSHFGTKKSTTGNKSKIIRELLNMDYYDTEFSTKKMRDNNPFDNMVMVDGLIVPLTSLPEEYQKAVNEARAKAKGEDLSFTTT